MNLLSCWLSCHSTHTVNWNSVIEPIVFWLFSLPLHLCKAFFQYELLGGITVGIEMEQKPPSPVGFHCSSITLLDSKDKKATKQNLGYLLFFFHFMHSTSLSKPGVHITHNASQLVVVIAAWLNSCVESSTFTQCNLYLYRFYSYLIFFHHMNDDFHDKPTILYLVINWWCRILTPDPPRHRVLAVSVSPAANQPLLLISVQLCTIVETLCFHCLLQLLFRKSNLLPALSLCLCVSEGVSVCVLPHSPYWEHWCFTWWPVRWWFKKRCLKTWAPFTLTGVHHIFIYINNRNP